MRRPSITRSIAASVAIASAASSAHAEPTTQACLGSLTTFLACPPGAQLAGTECRARDVQGRPAGPRQGPAVFMRDDRSVSFAASYKDHEKTGRVFRFDKHGRLASWTDMANDAYHGLSVTCLPDGRVWYLAYYRHGRVAGIARSWTQDGAFAYAMEHDARGRSRKIEVPAELQKRPDHLCQPRRCDVHAAPDLSGVPTPPGPTPRDA